MGPQLCCSLAIFGDVVHTREVLGLAGVALWSDTITLAQIVRKLPEGHVKHALHTLDFRFLQLSHAMEVIFPRGVRKAYVPEMGDWCCALEPAREPASPCFGARGALWAAFANADAEDDCGRIARDGTCEVSRWRGPRL